MLNSQVPLIEFFRAIPNARMPVRADKSAFGSIPVAAYKYCEPLTVATGYGWYIYSPIDFALVWDGSETLWTYEGEEAWYPLSTAQFPNYQDIFDSVAPDYARGFSPLFVSDSPRRGIIQIWSGLFVRTAPDWSIKIRPIVNYPASKSFALYEAIVETDQWFGPLFINIRLEVKNRPIRFSRDSPLFQVQLISRQSYAQSTYDQCVLHEEPLAFGEREWRAYERTLIVPNKAAVREHGAYARGARKRDRQR